MNETQIKKKKTLMLLGVPLHVCNISQTLFLVVKQLQNGDGCRGGCWREGFLSVGNCESRTRVHVVRWAQWQLLCIFLLGPATHPPHCHCCHLVRNIPEHLLYARDTSSLGIYIWGQRGIITTLEEIKSQIVKIHPRSHGWYLRVKDDLSS